MTVLKTVAACLLLSTTLGALVTQAAVDAAGASQLQIAQSTKAHWKSLTPVEAARKLKAEVKKGGKGGSVYGECYPSSGDGGEDCSDFLAICTLAGGGAGKLPGGGYSCDYRQD